MILPVKVSYVFSAVLPVARACRQACAYCAFRRPDQGLLPVATVFDQLSKIAASTAAQVVFMTGDTPQDDPSVQISLHREGFSSYWSYLDTIISKALDFGLFPVVAGGYFAHYDAERFATSGAALQIELVPETPCGGGEAHEHAAQRTVQAGRQAIENAHYAGIPYHLHLLVGIGETQQQRESWITTLGTFCSADPLLQDVTLRPFQPQPDTVFRARPPLALAQVQSAMRCLARAFPVHCRAVPPYLFYRFPELIEAGLNDLGAVPLLTGDPATPNLPCPSLEFLRRRVEEADAQLLERLPRTTPAGMRQPVLTTVVESQQARIAEQTPSAPRLIDNGMCFVCSQQNAKGLRVLFQQTQDNRWTAQWCPEPEYQGYAGIVHGGILAALLDEAMAQSLSSESRKVLTAELKVRFLQPVLVGLPIKITGVCDKKRGPLFVTSAQIYDKDGNVLAEAEGRFLEVRKKN